MADINKEIEEMSENMEKSTESETFSVEMIKSTIKTLGKERLKKALPNLSEEQKTLLKSVIEDMKKGKQDLEPKVESTDDGDQKENESKPEQTKRDEEIAEEAKKKQQQQIRNQGGNPIEGWEGQVIGEAPKQSEMPSKPSDVKVPSIMKSKEVSKEEAKEKLMEMEEKEHKTKNPKKLIEAEKKEHEEEKKEPLKKDFLQNLPKMIGGGGGPKPTPAPTPSSTPSGSLGSNITAAINRKLGKAEEADYGVDGDRIAKAKSKKFEDCVMDVKHKQGESKVNPWAVCHASLGKGEEMEENKQEPKEESREERGEKAMKKAKKKALKKALKKAAKIEAKGPEHWAVKEEKKAAKKNLKKMVSRMQERKMEKSECVAALAKSLGVGEEGLSKAWDMIEQKKEKKAEKKAKKELTKSESYKYDDGTVGGDQPEAGQSDPPPVVKDEVSGGVDDKPSVDVPAYKNKEAKKADGKKPLSGESQQEADSGERPPQTMKKSDSIYHEEEQVYMAKSANPFAERTVSKSPTYAVDAFLEASENDQKNRLAKSKFDYDSDEEILAKAEKMKKNGQESPAVGPKEAEEQDKLPEQMKKKKKDLEKCGPDMMPKKEELKKWGAELMEKQKKMKKSNTNELIEKNLDMDSTSVEQAKANIVRKSSGIEIKKSFSDVDMESLFCETDMWGEKIEKSKEPKKDKKPSKEDAKSLKKDY